MRRRSSLVVLTVILVLAAVLAAVGPAGAARKWTARPLRLSSAPIDGARAPSARLAQTDPSLLRLSGTKLVSVMVKFDQDGAASYQGNVAGLRATSPEVTGAALRASDADVSAYLRYTASRSQGILRSVQAAIPRAQVLRVFNIVYGGAALRVPANQIPKLLQIPGVTAVQRNALNQPETSVTPHFLKADAVWPSLGGPTKAARNVVVGVLDTGVWPEHPSFRDRGLPPFPGHFGCQFGNGTNPELGPDFTCNDKLIGAYAFTDTYMAVLGALPGEFCDNDTGRCSARDPDGHGTHTSSTAAGDGVRSARIFGIQRGPISGMAPGARVIMFRVCLDEGCFESDSMAAVEQAILDGVDVINFSIGGGATPYSDAVELTFLDAYAAGILVNASAGNDGPDAGTVEHGGAWVNTVAASTSNRNFLTTLHLTAPCPPVGTSGIADCPSLDVTGATITTGIDAATAIVAAADVPGNPDPGCLEPLPAGSATGMIVACEAQFSRNLRAFNVLQGGAAGMVLYSTDATADLFTDNFWVPTVMIVRDQAQAFADFLDAHASVAGMWDTGEPTHIRGDVVTGFSSRGPSTDFIKPDVTAPGVEILAGTTPQGVSVFSGPPGQHFQVIAGTSMSSPHAAGLSALVAAAHPGWTPGQIKSALMTSSLQRARKSDGVTPADPFDVGAGTIRANRAIVPLLTFDVPAADYYSSAGDELGRIDLNIPSINAPLMPGQISTTRWGKNVSGTTQTFSASADAPSGAIIKVTSPGWTVSAGHTLRLRITIKAPDLPEGQYFGSITLTNAKGKTVFIPVAFFRTQGAVRLAHSCAPTTIAVDAMTDCEVAVENNDASPANVELDVTTSDVAELRIRNVSAPGVGSGDAFSFDGTLAPAVAPPIESIDPGGSPGPGYLPLAGFGVPPLAGFGDETIATLGVPSFLYGSETYDAVAITSNGYAVVGGGEAADLNYIPQSLPDPARPNNVVAPFWTDLNPSVGGNLYAAELTDGVNAWIVLEWEAVPVYSTGDPVTMQIWIQEGTTESVTWAYGDIPAAGDPAGLTVGAENRDGTSGQMLGSVPADDSDYTVVAGAPTPGGTVVITYRAKALVAGNATLTARLRSPVMPGVSIQRVHIHMI